MRKIYYAFFVLFFGMYSGNSQDSKLQLIQSYLKEKGMSLQDVSDLKIQRESYSKSLQATNIYVIQQYNGVPIHGAIGSFAIRNGKVLSFAGNYVDNIPAKISAISPEMSAENAVKKASLSLNLGIVKEMKMLSNKKEGTANSYLFSKANISQADIPVTLMYELKDNKLMLCWDMSIHTVDGKNWYSVRIDASSGKMQSIDNWITECSFGAHNHTKKSTRRFSLFKTRSEISNSLMEPVYNVFPVPSLESPNHGDRQLISGMENSTASPFGWHDTDGVVGPEFTVTRGNNVIASEDFDGNNGIGRQPDGGAALQFDYPYDPTSTVANYENASVTNLFYVNNVVHDVWYQYGFDEASGNFQFNNYGKGGLGSDEVMADGIDGSSFNNANFGTPPDGSNPRMQMFLWNPQPDPSVQVFVVNNTSLAGSYTIVDNAFDPGHVDAPVFPNGITSNLVLVRDNDATLDVNDACSTIINASEITGNIAVIRRGECNFDDKVLRCRQSGAIAVLVVNNQATDPIPMGGGLAGINIPAVMIGMEDGEAIISKLSTESVNVTLSDAGLNLLATDGSFDNGIVIHEYGHGISTRLAGGANNSSCLRSCAEFDTEGNCVQSTEQMGEGWSDWFALMMTIEPGDAGADARGIGTFASGQPVTGNGIRPFPYSTDMNINPVTYADTNNQANFSAPHGVGSVWASMIWDLTWALIERDGYDPDLYNGTGGNNLAMQLIMDGLKLQSCNPGFVDTRNAIIAADEAANAGANVCLIWEVFARRGLGWSADQGDSQSRTDQTEAFDLPPVSQLNCELLGVGDNSTQIFLIQPNPSRGNFNIRVSRNLGPSSISIFDINGRLVFHEKTLLENIHSINTNLISGIYLLRIEAEEGAISSTEKIVIQ